ncbi:MAG TPA: hypothetical protein VG983_01215 [Caulobacterales bacterium]|nr:hypothetical protein [Caulobacterales bacterium]
MSEPEPSEAERRARNRFYLLLATVFFVAANAVSILAYILAHRAG